MSESEVVKCPNCGSDCVHLPPEGARTWGVYLPIPEDAKLAEERWRWQRYVQHYRQRLADAQAEARRLKFLMACERREHERESEHLHKVARDANFALFDEQRLRARDEEQIKAAHALLDTAGVPAEGNGGALSLVGRLIKWRFKIVRDFREAQGCKEVGK